VDRRGSASPPPGALGAGDCEAWRPGPLAQPTNAVTSLAFVVAGSWLARRASVVVPDERWRVRTAAGLLAATGLGSVAYHGPGGRVGHLVHDATLVLTAAWAPLGLGVAVPPCVATTVARRRRAAAAAAAVGAGSYVLGRTGSSVCRPAARWQWHGLWHVAAAVAAAAWSEATDVQPHLAGPREP
jgi:hypothetical protein